MRVTKLLALLLAALLLATLPVLAEGLEIEEEPVIGESEDVVFSEDVDNAAEEEDFMIFSDEPIEKGYADFLAEGEANDGGIPIDAAHFPDAVFRNYLAGEFDVDGDGVLSEEELEYTDYVNAIDLGIASLKGIEYLPGLIHIFCSGNQLTSLDVSRNPYLTILDCSDNQLTSLDLSKNTMLESVVCWGNQLTSLDVSHNPALHDLDCYSNRLTSLNVSKNTALTHLHCQENQLTSLDVSHNPALEALHCHNNSLQSLDVTHNPALDNLNCLVNKLTRLDLTHNPELTNLACSENRLTALDLSHNPKLDGLWCDDNQLTTLDVTHNPALVYLYCSGNQLAQLDVSRNSELIEFYCENNALTSLDVTHNSKLKYLYLVQNQLKSLELGNNEELDFLYCQYNELESLDLTGCGAALKQVLMDNPPFEEMGERVMGLENEGVYALYFDCFTTLTAGGSTLREGTPIKVVLDDCDFASIKAKTYTGKAIKPSVTVKYNGTKLVKGTDYTVTYKNNTKVGTATVTVTGKGNYTGSVKVKFKINPKPTTLSKVTPGKKKLTVTWKKQTKQVSGYQIQYGTKKDFSNAKKVTVKGAKTVKATLKSLKAKKNYYVRIRTYKTVSGKKYYSSWSKSKKVKTK